MRVDVTKFPSEDHWPTPKLKFFHLSTGNKAISWTCVQLSFCKVLYKKGTKFFEATNSNVLELCLLRNGNAFG